jgi:hypothetical protein
VKPTWLGVGNSPPEKTVAQEEPPKTPTPAPALAPPAIAPPPAEPKPSAMPPAAASEEPPPIGTKPPEQPATAVAAKSEPRPEPPVRRPPPSRESQPIQVVTSPGGAIVTLDGDMDSACTTPCKLLAPPGQHSLELRKAGFDVERRDLVVGANPIEMPAIVLRSQQGTLMLSSVPTGAKVLVNGKAQEKVTPAQLQLAPGSYQITVEWKDGRKSTHTVQITDGIKIEKFVMEQ